MPDAVRRRNRTIVCSRRARFAGKIEKRTQFGEIVWRRRVRRGGAVWLPIGLEGGEGTAGALEAL